jgi:hypothetical protein
MSAQARKTFKPVDTHMTATSCILQGSWRGRCWPRRTRRSCRRAAAPAATAAACMTLPCRRRLCCSRQRCWRPPGRWPGGCGRPRHRRRRRLLRSPASAPGAARGPTARPSRAHRYCRSFHIPPLSQSAGSEGSPGGLGRVRIRAVLAAWAEGRRRRAGPGGAALAQLCAHVGGIRAHSAVRVPVHSVPLRRAEHHHQLIPVL